MRTTIKERKKDNLAVWIGRPKEQTSDDNEQFFLSCENETEEKWEHFKMNTKLTLGMH
jgi:hypothetical protein